MDRPRFVPASRRALIVLLPAALAGCFVPRRPAVPRPPVPGAVRPPVPGVGYARVGPVVPIMRVHVAPPVPRFDVRPRPPAPGLYWSAGYWRWDGAAYLWEPGVWVAARPGEFYIPARWAYEGGAWVFYPAYWRPIEASPGLAVVDVPRPPPEPHEETAPPAPGIEHFWVAGHWRWDNGDYVWAAGHWEAMRPGYYWVPAQWVAVGADWRYVPGQWQAN
jgi:hypothetical protein